MSEKQRPYWAMGGITNEDVETYLYSMLPEREPVLREMEEYATQNRVPIVGPAVGRFFCQIGRLMQARSVFEMGSAIGYSTIWWAMAVGEGGKVVYTDGDRKNAERARGHFQRAGVADRIEIQVGDALEILSEQKRQFDVVFNDVDKEDYPRVLRLAVPKVRSGGLFITDNVLWSGRVAQTDAEKDERTRAILEFNRQLYASKELYTTLIPLRDGLGMALRL